MMPQKSARRILPILLSLSAIILSGANSPAQEQYCMWDGSVKLSECAAPEAYQPEHNGVLRLYNMFPRSYSDIDAMTADLPRIRAMGFSHVWINPMHETTEVEKKKWPEGTPNGLKGSLYSMRDPQMINPEFSVVSTAERKHMSREAIWELDKAALTRFAATATELGMVPMFDLVLSHLAPDSAIVDGTHPKFSGVDTKPWFDRYENGKPKRHGLDQEGNILPGIKYPDKEVWDDVVMLEYEDAKIRHEITEHLWKPFVKDYFDMGFKGIRVDSVANNHAEVMQETLSYFSELHQQRYGIAPTILGESLGGTMEQQGKIRGQATHLYNSAYWVPNLTGPNISDDKRDPRALWSSDSNWFLHEAGQKQDIIFRDKNGELITGRKGGTVGYAGSHDELPWVYHFPTTLPPIEPVTLDEVMFKAHEPDFPIDAKAAVRGLREKVAMAALASDGGWFMTSFDDKADTTLRSVFDKKHEGKSLGDISDLVTDINAILKQMPQNQLGSWAKRHFLPNRDNLVIIQRHTGFGHNGPSNLVLVNADPEQEVQLTPQEIHTLAQRTGMDAAAFLKTGKDGGVWYGRDVQPPSQEQMAAKSGAMRFVQKLLHSRDKAAQAPAGRHAS